MNVAETALTYQTQCRHFVEGLELTGGAEADDMHSLAADWHDRILSLRTRDRHSTGHGIDQIRSARPSRSAHSKVSST
ncbi:hypothetical protein BRC83_10620 [Halobacteriales archaeon QS_1_68_17]|nr:MAG: hypothetical protein BRC83_10620 [Halobacteriales archaeon QS_1_68_17]